MSCRGEITLSDAVSISFSRFICSLERILRFSRSASSSCEKYPIFLRIVLMYFFGAYTGREGTQKATRTPAMVGWIPAFRKKNHTNAPMMV